MTPLAISKLTVERYKSFEQPTTINVAPVTILLGKNSSGKSALARALLFAAQTFVGTERPFQLSVAGVDFGSSLNELAYEGAKTGFRLGLRWGDVSWSIEVRGEGQPPYAQIVGAAQLLTKGEDSVKFDKPTWAELRDGLLARPQLSSWARRVQHLGDVRQVPDRTTELFETTKIGPCGRDTPIVLASDREHLARVNEWFGSYLPEHQVDVEQQAGELRTLVRRGNARVSISQVGAGVAQVLPVISLLTSKLEASDTLILEHPELHLHPSAHVGVAELLVATANSASPPKVIVESHSDLVIWRIRRAIAERRLDHTKVALWHVDHDGVKQIELDDRGTPSWWPAEVFADLHAEVTGIRSALAARES